MRVRSASARMSHSQSRVTQRLLSVLCVILQYFIRQVSLCVSRGGTSAREEERRRLFSSSLASPAHFRTGVTRNNICRSNLYPLLARASLCTLGSLKYLANITSRLIDASISHSRLTCARARTGKRATLRRRRACVFLANARPR